MNSLRDRFGKIFGLDRLRRQGLSFFAFCPGVGGGLLLDRLQRRGLRLIEPRLRTFEPGLRLFKPGLNSSELVEPFPQLLVAAQEKADGTPEEDTRDQVDYPAQNRADDDEQGGQLTPFRARFPGAGTNRSRTATKPGNPSIDDRRRSM